MGNNNNKHNLPLELISVSRSEDEHQYMTEYKALYNHALQGDLEQYAEGLRNGTIERPVYHERVFKKNKKQPAAVVHWLAFLERKKQEEKRAEIARKDLTRIGLI